MTQHYMHLTQRLDSVFAVALSPTNPDLAASGGGDDKAFLWNIRNGEKLHELKGAYNCKCCIEACSRASLRSHRLCQLCWYDLGASGVGALPSLSPVAFNFDGTLLATGALDGLVKIWNTATGALVKDLEGAVRNTLGPDLRSLV